jgi:hypothetical protein
MVGLNDAGVAKDQPNLVRAIDWILREEIRVPGAGICGDQSSSRWLRSVRERQLPRHRRPAEVALRGASAPGARPDVEAAIPPRRRVDGGHAVLERRLGTLTSTTRAGSAGLPFTTSAG